MTTSLSVRWVTNIAELETIVGTSYPSVFVAGYNSPGDGGGGFFYYNSGDTTSPSNGATIIVADNGDRFYRIWDGGQFNLLWAGADRTGAASSDAAMEAALGVAAYIYVPNGRYRFDNQISYAFPPGYAAFSLVGDGPDATTLYFTHNSGIALTYDTVDNASTAHVRDLTLAAGQANAGIGLNLIYASTSNINFGLTDITNVRCRGDDGIGELFWNQGIRVQGVSNVNFTGVVISGPLIFSSGAVGLELQGNSKGSIVYNINSCILDYNLYGLLYGDYIQGVTITNTQFTNCVYGVIAVSGETSLVELAISGSQFDTTTCSILAQSQIGSALLSNNSFYLESGGTVAIQGIYTNSTITGNTFDCAEASAIGILVSGGDGGVISGNYFLNFGTGVSLQSGTAYWNVQSNQYVNVAIPVQNEGTSNTVGGGSP